jgi:hypothetical protein
MILDIYYAPLIAEVQQSLFPRLSNQNPTFLHQTFQLLDNIQSLAAQWLYNPYNHPLSPIIQYHALQNPLDSHKQLVNKCKKEGRKSTYFHRFTHISPHLCIFLRLGHVSIGQDMQIKLQYGLGYNLCDKIWFLSFAHILCTFQSTLYWLSLYPSHP